MSSLLFYSTSNNLHHVVELFVCHTRIHTDPERVVHDTVGILQTTDNAIALTARAHLVEAGMLDEIAGKEHARLHAVFLNEGHNLFAVNAFAARHEETKPAWARVLAGLGQDELVRDRR